MHWKKQKGWREVFEQDGIEIERKRKRKRDNIKNVLSLFFQKFHTVTTSTPTTGNPPKTVPSQTLLSPAFHLIPQHLQPLLALTLNLNLNHLPSSHTPLALRKTGFWALRVLLYCSIAREAQYVLAQGVTTTDNHLVYQSGLYHIKRIRLDHFSGPPPRQTLLIIICIQIDVYTFPCPTFKTKITSVVHWGMFSLLPSLQPKQYSQSSQSLVALCLL